MNEFVMEKTSMSRNNSRGRTLRLNPALNSKYCANKNKLNKIRYARDNNAITIRDKHEQTQWSKIRQDK